MSSREEFVDGAIARVVGELLHAPLGCKIHTPKSGLENGVKADRFSVLVPYCGEMLRWFVIFNARDDLMPPDVVMQDNMGSDIEWHKLQSVVKWDGHDRHSLVRLVQELLTALKRSQCGLVSSPSARLQFELESMRDMEDLEVLVVSKDGKRYLRCRVPLHKALPAWLRLVYAPHTSFALTLTYDLSSPDSPPLVVLSYPPGYERAYGAVQLPVWQADTCLHNFVDVAREVVNEHATRSTHRAGRRHKVLSELAKCLCDPLECDTALFCRATFGVDLRVNSPKPFKGPFVITVQLSDSEPARGVTISMQSLQYSMGPSVLSSQVRCPVDYVRQDASLCARELCKAIHSHAKEHIWSVRNTGGHAPQHQQVVPIGEPS